MDLEDFMILGETERPCFAFGLGCVLAPFNRAEVETGTASHAILRRF